MHPSADAGVSVIIPVWDSYVTYVAEAVASVIDQHVGADVLVVDNASDVPLPPLAGARVLRAPERLSTGAARNLGLSQVRTPYVVFLDADDVMLAGSLAKMAEDLEHAEGAVACCHAIVVRETGLRHRSPRPLAGTLARLPRLFAVANSVWSLLPTQGATMMRTIDVRAAGGYADASIGEEWALAAALAWRGRIHFDPEPALAYRWRGEAPEPSGKRARLLSDARGVRRRLRENSSTPRSARVLLPLIATCQWTAISVVRPAWRTGRRAVARGRRRGPRRPW